mmetsp:Transcript_79624/g.215339  ORF Transcript_79624/g.215339 Transcript_79624/m.215339 type:complete len:218 (-) Transcript_79624:53-706(-)
MLAGWKRRHGVGALGVDRNPTEANHRRRYQVHGGDQARHAHRAAESLRGGGRPDAGVGAAEALQLLRCRRRHSRVRCLWEVSTVGYAATAVERRLVAGARPLVRASLVLLLPQRLHSLVRRAGNEAPRATLRHAHLHRHELLGRRRWRGRPQWGEGRLFLFFLFFAAGGNLARCDSADAVPEARHRASEDVRYRLGRARCRRRCRRRAFRSALAILR